LDYLYDVGRFLSSLRRDIWKGMDENAVNAPDNA
jgi:hypothetical protein